MESLTPAGSWPATPQRSPRPLRVPDPLDRAGS
jgi:hypothetical protein